MLPRPDTKTIATIKDAANKLTGSLRREFQAQVVIDHCSNSTHFARTLFGWGQPALRRALQELKTGKVIPDAHRKGRTPLSEKFPNLQDDIRSLVDPESQTHPTFKTKFRYTRVTAKSVREALVSEKGYTLEGLPALSTMRELLGKMGYRLRRVQKTKPKKKFPRPTQSLPTSKPSNKSATPTTKRCESR